MNTITYVEWKREAERNRDEESTNHNRDISRVVTVENVPRLRFRWNERPYRVPTEGHVPCEGVQGVNAEDENVGKEDDSRDAFLRGLLEIGNDGDELDLGAMSVAENGKSQKDVARKDKCVRC